MEFFAPTRPGEAEYTEKRSRFIGKVFPAADEDDAKRIIERVRAAYRDARHNPWCYLLTDGASRASDDGEPSGTSGSPILEMLRRENIRGVAAVVTRYFGGVLLGPGGLSRAYTAAAKAALEDSMPRLFVTKTLVTVRCPYPAAPKIKHEISSCNGSERSTDYAGEVTVAALFDKKGAEDFYNRVIEITAGSVVPEISGEVTVPAE